ncbi:Cd2+/Zn2+-exporting ATPase [Verrucomicrobium sp. GAS474]|uniref:heavy metal translocating P-type ATPase n=1 Tax=Verrucomicrobium sp. GAS474 TaxID=1882831 RepID=UPI00087B64E0|nr:cation-translocating P-type ATPase [Verrucomicrobium sp. GAS474]SDT90958.1 Cd2+/Zn2+-exporting ATPase [Verrucomicrobium sp. GAS474]
MKPHSHDHDHGDHSHDEHDHSHKEKGDCCGHDHDHGKPDAKPQSIALNAESKGNLETTLRVAGMDCADEVEALEQVFRPVKGIREVKVNLMGGKVTLRHDETVSPDDLIQLVAKAGLKGSRDDAPGEEEDVDSLKRQRQIAVGISGVTTGLGLLMGWMKLGPAWAADIPFAIAIVSGGWFVVPKAIRAVSRFSLDMNVLMTVAVAGALAIHQWSEGAAVAFLFALSELLEAFSLTRARKAVQSLMKLTPEVALLKKGDSFEEVPVAEVETGSTILVKSGQRIPLDGKVVRGESSVDQAPITGESMPVAKKTGDEVYAGTINGDGSLEIETTKAYSDTTLSKIIHLVEEAQSQKAPSQRFVDQFARYYTPAVMVAAFLVILIPPLAFGGEWMTWIYRGLVLLVIACPCALVISTPVSVVSGLTAMARRGVLIKGGAVLEAVGRLKALAVDKTGTITEGKPRVTEIVRWKADDENQIVRIAAAIDTHSEHPLAKAVVSYANEKKIAFPKAEQYQSKSGRGAEATVEGHRYFVGNHRFTHELGVCTPDLEKKLSEIEADAQSVVIVGHRPHDGCPGEVLGILAVGDAIRANAREAIAALHKAGIEKVVMLSGDNQRTASAIAEKAGIDEAHGDLLPDQKVENVKKLIGSHGFVGMVGDGVNDAPAMATATVGIAMGAAGTDTAIETADMALMQDDLTKVADAIRLGRRTVGVIKFNIGFALALKAVFLAMAVTGHASLWLAILADTGATLLVVMNAMRLLRP